MTPLLRAVLRTFDARCAWVGIRKTDQGEFDWTLGLAHTGQSCDRPPLSEMMQSRCLAHTQYLCVPESPAKSVGSAMAVPMVCQSGNLGMLYVENDSGAAAYDQAALDALSSMACCVARPVENVLRKVATKRRVTATTEHTVARATQDAVTPKALPQWDELQVAVYRRAGSARCHDFYDVMQLRDKTASIVIARPGVRGELLSRYFAELRAAFRATALYSEPPHLFARALNWIIFEGDARHTIDLACVSVAPKTGKVRYCIAGKDVHLGRIHADGTCEMITPEAAPPIGQTRGPAFTSQTFDLASGDTLVLATDGINTARNASGDVFGWDGLKDNLCDGLGDTPSHMLSEFASDLADFLEGGDCTDDLTVLLVQRQ
jgi:DNA-binding transcriptional regulator YdaS (Cro superfamily)